jgi:RIO kinase 1
MNSQLDLLLSEGILDEVLGRLKSGKEAEVFRVVYRGAVVAAKVYKDRQQRSFQHNVAYKEGRKVRNSRTQRAIDKGSRFGRDEAEDAWKSSEATTLQLLHRQGVRVPTPVLFYEGVLLMELVSDADGDIAPRLIEAAIDPENAAALYRDLRGEIIKVLCCDLIHGDLSPYNVLLGANGPTIIDFPQAISAAHNSQSEGFFQRDFENIHSFFEAHDRRLVAQRSDGREIWRAYARRELSPDFVPMTRQAPPPRPPQQQRFNEQRPSGQRFNEQRPNEPRFNDQRPNEPRFNDQRPNDQRPNPPRFNDQRPNPPRFDDQQSNEHRPNPQRGGPRPPVAERFAEERPRDHRADNPRSGGQRGGDQRSGAPRHPGQRQNEQRHSGQRQNEQRPSEQRPGAAQPPAGPPAPVTRSAEWPSRPRVYEPPPSGARTPSGRSDAGTPDPSPRATRTRSRRR